MTLINGAKDADHDWLTHTLGLDATYIARLIMNGQQETATAYIRDTDYLNRLQQWRSGK